MIAVASLCLFLKVIVSRRLRGQVQVQCHDSLWQNNILTSECKRRVDRHFSRLQVNGERNIVWGFLFRSRSNVVDDRASSPNKYTHCLL